MWAEPVDDGVVTPDTSVVRRFSDAEDDSGDDGRSKFVGRLFCGGILGIRNDDSGAKSPVAPLPEPDAPDACVVSGDDP